MRSFGEPVPTSEIAIALNRFGLGAGAADSAPADGRTWLRAQLDRFEPRPQPIAGLPARTEVAGELANYLEELRSLNRQQRRTPSGGRPEAMPAPTTAAGQAQPETNPDLAGLPEQVRRFIRRSARDHYLAMVAARTQAALVTPAPFVERLVHFWANHFAVSADKLTVIGLAGLLEFEAIRPHVLGRFSDMLRAVEQHPAMLLYLDQAQSVPIRKPDSSPPGSLGSVAD